jgi:hypothetical protein
VQPQRAKLISARLELWISARNSAYHTKAVNILSMGKLERVDVATWNLSLRTIVDRAGSKKTILTFTSLVRHQHSADFGPGLFLKACTNGKDSNWLRRFSILLFTVLVWVGFAFAASFSYHQSFV